MNSLEGKNVMVLCLNYIYAGKLIGMDSDFIKLKDPSIVYETGDLRAKSWKDAQKLPADIIFIKSSCVESMCESGR